MNNLDPTHQKLLDAIVHRATLDAPFRALVLRDPAAAIRDSFGVELPAGYRLRFVEKDAGVDEMIVLPAFKASGEELSDDELENVAGGTGTSDDWAPPPPPPTGTP
jgi:hypothetical protein